MKEGQFGRAEESARASLAQYVIWTRQHTAITMHVAPDLYRQMLEIDGPALEAHIARLQESLVASGNSTSLLPVLRQVSAVIGVPELSVRMTARAAQWLFESGDYGGAVTELKSLGNVEQLSDTLALMLVNKLLDLPDDKQTQVLARAVSGAFTEEEKWFAELELARHLLACDQRSDALRNVDSVISETRNQTYAQKAFADALFLRSQITRSEEDFHAAEKEINAFSDQEHKQRFAMMLIEHGDFDKAERVLAEDLEVREPVAQLLAVDARLRAGRIDAAHALL